MSDPRENVDFEGLKVHRATYKIDGTTIVYDATKVGGSEQVGLMATLAAAKTAGLVGDGEAILGKIVSVSNGYCVIEEGYTTAPAGEGATLTLGAKVVGDLGPSSAEGYIRAVDSAVAAELAVGRGQIIDASDTTAVIIKLEG